MEGRSNPKNLPEANLNCLERSSHAMRLCHRGEPYDTSWDLARRINGFIDDVHALTVDSAILGWLIDKRFLAGETPEQVMQWMIDNGVRNDLAKAWFDRAPMPWNGDEAKRREDAANAA